MSKNPILRSAEIGNRKVQAVGGLHMIRGNGAPYFTLTIESWVRGREDSFGCAHGELVRKWPELKPLAALHLSSIDGVPMHAESNGWYQITGAIPELQGQYHLGNSKVHHDGKYGEPDADYCLARFAEHARISLNEARGLAVVLIDAYQQVPQYSRVWEGGGIKAARAVFATWIEAQKPRWKAEADKCIADLGLVVFGDAWKREEVAA